MQHTNSCIYERSLSTLSLDRSGKVFVKDLANNSYDPRYILEPTGNSLMRSKATKESMGFSQFSILTGTKISLKREAELQQ